MIEILLTVSVLLSSAVYFVFLLSIIRGLKLIKCSPPNNQSVVNPFISVIIPCRNEAQNIPGNIADLLVQNYPRDLFEVIFVDDHSEDSTAAIVLSYTKSDSRIRLLTMKDSTRGLSGKKQAIAYGIEHTKGEIIVTTDADCRYSSTWLTTIAGYFDDETGFLSGPVTFHQNKGFFQSMQVVEFAGLVLAGAGLIGLSHPTICNGANIAYRKSLFYQVNGFADNHGLSSGDDELVMRKIHKLGTYRVKFAANAGATVLTDAAKTLGEFLNQRARWASKGLYYNKLFVLLGLIPFFLFFLSLLVLPILGVLFREYYFLLFLILFCIKGLIEFAILRQGKAFLGTKVRFAEFFLAQTLHPLYIVVASFLGTFKSYTWKERVIKH